MIAVIGLGNPGKEYEQTVHNIGWLVLDRIAGEHEWVSNKYAQAKLCSLSSDILLVKPETFMNKSGDVVSYVQKNYDLSPKQYVVIHDDLDMPFGTVRVIENRGSGGHNGVQSIASALGTNEFVRIRIGVAREVEPGRIIKPDVLGKLMKEELEQVPDIALRVGKILELISISGVGPAMTAFN